MTGYSPTQFLLTHLLQQVYTRLEQTKTLYATGGSTTTIIDTALTSAYLDDQFVGYTAFVTKDSAGAGAAPEGEYQRVSAYASSTKTLTVPAFSAAVAAGDVIAVAKGSLYPLQDVIRICNQALEKLETVRQVDDTLVGVAAQTEYTAPIAIKGKILDVLVPTTTDTDDNQWVSVNFKTVPAVPGSTETLIVPQPEVGKKIRLLWEGPHAVLSTFSDPISEYIPRDLAVSVCALEVGQTKSQINPDLLAKLTLKYNESRALHPIRPMARKISGMVHWS